MADTAIAIDDSENENDTPMDQVQGEGEARVEELDHEDKLLKQAEADLAVETDADPDASDKPAEDEAKDDGDKGDKAEGGDKPVVTDRDDGEEAPQQTPMIPKARFDEAVADARRGTDEALQAAAYWKGRAEAPGNARDQGTTGQPAEQPPTPEQQIVFLRARKAEMAKQYDEGELTAQELEVKRDEIEDRIHEIREAQTRQGTPQPQTSNEDLYLDQLTASLEAKHPYTAVIPDDAPQWKILEQEAAWSLKEDGVTLVSNANGALEGRSAFALRERMAELTDSYGPMWAERYGWDTSKISNQKAPETPADGKGDPTPAPAKPGLSPTAQARQDKLDVARNQPPDLSNLGSSGEGTEVTEADIEVMSDDEINALPASVKRKFELTP